MVLASIVEVLLPDASAPINFPKEESYFKNLPFSFAVDLCTSSKNSKRSSPPPELPLAKFFLLTLALIFFLKPFRSSRISSLNGLRSTVVPSLPASPGNPCSPLGPGSPFSPLCP